MEFLPLMLFAVAVVGLGAAATVLLTDWIAPPVAQLASQHGRFMASAARRPQDRREAINVVRT